MLAEAEELDMIVEAAAAKAAEDLVEDMEHLQVDKMDKQIQVEEQAEM
jgi:predicted dinucleotide-utilizing enzyme